MRAARLVAATLGLTLLAACGGPATPVPPAPAGGTPIETRLLPTSQDPYIPSPSIIAASDLDTLRAVVDAMRPADAQGPGPCRPPYGYGGDDCWPGTRSQPGHAYLALDLVDGFCQLPSRPQLYVLPGRRLVLQVGFSKGFCPGAADAPPPHAALLSAGVPRASLVSISTTGLTPGLYTVSYRFLAESAAYDSGPAYLSVPGPAAASQTAVEDALLAIRAGDRQPLFSVARVAGDQVGDLCGQRVDGPAYLVTTGSALAPPHRQLTVVLAGPPSHTCAVIST